MDSDRVCITNVNRQLQATTKTVGLVKVEVLKERLLEINPKAEICMCPKAIIAAGNPELINHEWCSSKAQINGTSAHITAIFGFMLAGLVMNDLYAN